ncbi:MAG: elongation factor P, partial [Bdellovibrionales bacterium]|nr:elongation factor P [Bdellovibrionales bacterium]
PFSVVEFEHVKPGKGSAFSRCRLKNLKTGQLLERTFKSGERFPEPNLEHRVMQYLYPDGDMYTLMDNENYEQLVIGKALLGDQSMFLKENMEVNVLFFDEKPLTVELPIFVELPILYTEPGFKGDTATGGTKPAKLQGGHQVAVPLHLKEGDILKIDTRTGEYVEKINK